MNSLAVCRFVINHLFYSLHLEQWVSIFRFKTKPIPERSTKVAFVDLLLKMVIACLLLASGLINLWSATSLHPAKSALVMCILQGQWLSKYWSHWFSMTAGQLAFSEGALSSCHTPSVQISSKSNLQGSHKSPILLPFMTKSCNCIFHMKCHQLVKSDYRIHRTVLAASAHILDVLSLPSNWKCYAEKHCLFTKYWFGS